MINAKKIIPIGPGTNTILYPTVVLLSAFLGDLSQPACVLNAKEFRWSKTVN